MILDQLDNTKVQQKIGESLDKMPVTEDVLRDLGFTYRQTSLCTLSSQNSHLSYWYYTDVDGAEVALEKGQDDVYIGEVFFPQYDRNFLAPKSAVKEYITVTNIGELKKFIEASNKAAELRKYIREESEKIKSITDEISYSKTISSDIDSILDSGGLTSVGSYTSVLPDISVLGKYNEVSVGSPI